MPLSKSRSPWARAPALAPAEPGPTPWQASRPCVRSAHWRVQPEVSSTRLAARRLICVELRQSWNHSAFKQFVGDGRRYPVYEHASHLGIAAQKIYGFLFSLRFWLPSLLPQLLAGRILIFLDDLVGGRVQQWVLSATYPGE